MNIFRTAVFTALLALSIIGSANASEKKNPFLKEGETLEQLEDMVRKAIAATKTFSCAGPGKYDLPFIVTISNNDKTVVVKEEHTNTATLENIRYSDLHPVYLIISMRNVNRHNINEVIHLLSIVSGINGRYAFRLFHPQMGGVTKGKCSLYGRQNE